ncbi:MAG TPA: TIGR03617 family F420-dependent LLM class oxidoreductase [Iamia sp.]|nr:TIGR03617 family F420-dependent LLM class oxidoreductase [Iamia sp.]
MLIDKMFDTYDPTTFVAEAKALEEAGYDGLLLGEAAMDPLVPLAIATQHTTTVDLVSAVAIALPRSPTHVAYAANDLQAFSGGRLVLGLGSQIRAHVERRFGATWTKPVAQMREFILAIRALYAAWEAGTGVDFRGDHYEITLMTPYFSPAVAPSGPPPIWLAGVGERMCTTAGEVADGLFVHPFTTPRYLQENLLGWAEAGRARAGDRRPSFGVALPVLVGTGADDDVEAAIAAVRKQIAFYGSTPAYRPVLELHGWGDLQPELNQLSKAGRWDEMTGLIDDEVLHTFAITGTPKEVGAGVVERYGQLVTRASIYTPNHHVPAELMAELLDAARAAAA